MVNTFTVATNGFSNAPVAYGTWPSGQSPRTVSTPTGPFYIQREDGSGVVQLESGAGNIELEAGP